jgi:hypothetical protein
MINALVILGVGVMMIGIVLSLIDIFKLLKRWWSL